MDEYIKRESVYYVLTDLLGDIENDEEVSCEFASGFERALSLTEDKVKEITAADVAPIRRGRWLERTDGGEGLVCSRCNGGYTVYDETPYCPNCGAKMDGKDGNKND